MSKQERMESPHVMMILSMKSGHTSNFWSVAPLHDGLPENMAKCCRFLFSTICVQEQILIFLWCLILLEILLYFDIELSVFVVVFAGLMWPKAENLVVERLTVCSTRYIIFPFPSGRVYLFLICILSAQVGYPALQPYLLL